jgi:pyruvate/2-oxoglutarate dehydrogenase complex dihydrolipoamide dehydrogenase (E3) component
MEKILKVDLCVIGAGSGGLSTAAGAVQMGASVVLIEANKMGGDCLNYGCVPSKSFLAAAKLAQNIKNSAQFGIESTVKIHFDQVMRYVENVIKTISVNDSVERFQKLGVKVILAEAKFIDAHTVIAGEKIIKARRFVIATGSSPSLPAIPGLEKINYFTNETIFNLKQKPEHLIVIGGGPIGCELAQAFLMLGTKVTLLEALHILPHDEPDLVDILRHELLRQELILYENCKNIQITQNNNNQIEVNFDGQSITGSEILIATGRRANVDTLNLAVAGIHYSEKGITVNSRLRTTNKKVYAIGDVIGSYQFTHMASYHAGIVLRNILFHLRAKVNYAAVPWVTYTEPELAHVGMLSNELKNTRSIKTLQWNFAENDRAQTEHKTQGKIKVLTTKKGKILGVSIIGSQAGELLTPWIGAIQEGRKIREMTRFIIPYPTLSEINKRVAGEFFTPLLFSERTKRLVRLMRIFG